MTEEKRHYRLNLYTSLLAIGISVAAMGVSLLEVTAMREQQRAEVWPYLEFRQSFSEEGFRLTLANKGVGPALVGTANMMSGDRVIDDLDAFIAETVGAENAFSYDVYRTSNPTNSVLSPGESVTVFLIPWEPRTQLLMERWGSSVNFDACYCSIHEECWLTDIKRSRPVSVSSCQ
ncbi:MAG: hypothetical protein AAF004_01620 [Pseudomonadota bacterium]